MNNVHPIAGKASPTIEDVVNWITQKGERGELGENAARLRVTALKQITSILQPDEPQEARWVLENTESLARRWATKKNANGATAKTYESRARGTLEDYFRWQEDPVGFRFGKGSQEEKASGERSQRPRKAPAGRPKAPAAAPQAAEPPAPPPSPAPLLRNFPLGDSGAFEFRLPEGGITVRDWKKIACHLLTLARDFDPSMPQHANALAVVAQADPQK